MLAELEPYLHLIAVGGGLLLALFVLTWLGRGAGKRREPAQTIALTPGHALHVVELAGRRLVVGTGPSGPPSLLLELSEIGTPNWAVSAGEAPPWVADAARRGPEGWTADGP